MKLGILLAGRRPEDIAKRLEQCREAGYSFCQLNLHQTGFTRQDLAAIADVMVDQGVRPVAVGCYVNPLQPEDASFMGSCRADLDTLLHSLDIIGARKVVMWSGTRAASIFDPHPDNATPESREALRAFLTDVVRNTRARHYYLVLEPWHGHVLNDGAAVAAFHRTLLPDVAERVRYVMDAPSLLTPSHFADCDGHAEAVCRTLGPHTGIVHLKDCLISEEGEAAACAPGQGGLHYDAYLEAIFQSAPPDAAAIVRNVPPPEYAAVRDYLIRTNRRWELA